MDAYFAMFVSEFVFTSVNFHGCVDLKSDKRFSFIVHVHVDVLENMHTCIYKSKAYINTIINLVHAKSMNVDPIF